MQRIKRNPWVFVSYYYENKPVEGYGSRCLEINSNLSKPDNILAIKKYIEETNGFDNVVLLSWRRLE